MAFQLWGVYSPDVPGPAGPPGVDKLVHGFLFGLPALAVAAGRLRPRILLPLLAIHAPVSELVQHYFLPDRTGDPFDALADLVGVAAGAGLGVVWRRHTR